MEESDHRHRLLLRVRRDWPRSHTAEQCDERATFQLPRTSRASDQKDSTPPNDRRLLHPSQVRRYEISAIAPPIIFSKEVAQKQATHFRASNFPQGPELVHTRFPGMAPG